MIIDLFAGIGWAEGIKPIGLNETGLELNPTACTTRRGARHTTVECDVTRQNPADYNGDVIASPPCPGFGKSGKKLGLQDLPRVHQAINDLAAGRDTRTEHGARMLDERSILTAEPMRWLHALRPEWTAMEQVPSVLPVWEHMAEILRSWGYSTATGVLDAADYGLGQRRPRAILIASRVRGVLLPAPTHGGLGQPPHTAMADVVGWGYTRRPAPTVTGGGTATGGAEPFGNGTRQAMRRTMGSAAWKGREGVAHLRPTIAECAELQGFRPGLVFHGTAGQRHLMVGNAVPPLLAAHVVSAATGIPMPEQAPEHAAA
ncbi:DNA cytosine methyltransferase [Streptomyces sp. MS06]|uniref:DNA cytosine methyltransferase n=1 Tax=Streptomyces sp. MS06 TaxID=3385974 RepID=UPI0039A19568